jgi:hypothetical protein
MIAIGGSFANPAAPSDSLFFTNTSLLVCNSTTGVAPFPITTIAFEQNEITSLAWGATGTDETTLVMGKEAGPMMKDDNRQAGRSSSSAVTLLTFGMEVWNAAGVRRCNVNPPSEAVGPNSLALSPDGSQLVVGYKTGSLVVYDVAQCDNVTTSYEFVVSVGVLNTKFEPGMYAGVLSVAWSEYHPLQTSTYTLCVFRPESDSSRRLLEVPGFEAIYDMPSVELTIVSPFHRLWARTYLPESGVDSSPEFEFGERVSNRYLPQRLALVRPGNAPFGFDPEFRNTGALSSDAAFYFDFLSRDDCLASTDLRGYMYPVDAGGEAYDFDGDDIDDDGFIRTMPMSHSFKGLCTIEDPSAPVSFGAQFPLSSKFGDIAVPNPPAQRNFYSNIGIVVSDIAIQGSNPNHYETTGCVQPAVGQTVTFSMSTALAFGLDASLYFVHPELECDLHALGGDDLDVSTPYRSSVVRMHAAVPPATGQFSFSLDFDFEHVLSMLSEDLDHFIYDTGFDSMYAHRLCVHLAEGGYELDFYPLGVRVTSIALSVLPADGAVSAPSHTVRPLPYNLLSFTGMGITVDWYENVNLFFLLESDSDISCLCAARGTCDGVVTMTNVDSPVPTKDEFAEYEVEAYWARFNFSAFQGKTGNIVLCYLDWATTDAVNETLAGRAAYPGEASQVLGFDFPELHNRFYEDFSSFGGGSTTLDRRRLLDDDSFDGIGYTVQRSAYQWFKLSCLTVNTGMFTVSPPHVPANEDQSVVLEYPGEPFVAGDKVLWAIAGADCPAAEDDQWTAATSSSLLYTTAVPAPASGQAMVLSFAGLGVVYHAETEFHLCVSTTVCGDTAGDGLDIDGKDCDYYQQYHEDCGSSHIYATANFSASEMCCVCGGGAPALGVVYPLEASLIVTPAVVSMAGDPHVRSPGGDWADFHGEAGVYQLYHGANVEVDARLGYAVREGGMIWHPTVMRPGTMIEEVSLKLKDADVEVRLSVSGGGMVSVREVLKPTQFFTAIGGSSRAFQVGSYQVTWEPCAGECSTVMPWGVHEKSHVLQIRGNGEFIQLALASCGGYTFIDVDSAPAPDATGLLADASSSPVALFERLRRGGETLYRDPLTAAALSSAGRA